MTARQPYQDAVLAPEDIAMIRLALTTCSQLLSWAAQHGGPQLHAAIAEISQATGIGRSPTAPGYAVSLALHYLDLAPAPAPARTR